LVSPFLLISELLLYQGRQVENEKLEVKARCHLPLMICALAEDVVIFNILAHEVNYTNK
jgi:hypothetical protein